MAKNLKILIFPDPRLRKVAEKVTKFDKSLENLANSMLKTILIKGIKMAWNLNKIKRFLFILLFFIGCKSSTDPENKIVQNL